MLCPMCGYANADEALLCEQCGFAFEEPRWGALPLQSLHEPDPNQLIMFVVGHPKTPINATLDKILMIGRTDDNTTEIPDIDLTPYDAISNGVSRRHAQIERKENGAHIEDIGSRNHTYLNGQRLGIYQPRILRHGDEIRLGNLRLYVYFSTLEAYRQ